MTLTRFLFIVLIFAAGSSIGGPAHQPASRLDVESGREVALTVDDVPGSAGMTLDDVREINRSILAALQTHRVPAVGFVNEQQIYVAGQMDARVQILQRWLDAGMLLGNHTFSHPDLNVVPLQDYLEDIVRGEVITRQLMMKKNSDRLYFRHPYNRTGTTLERRSAVETFLHSRGYVIAPYTVEHSDYMFDAAYLRAMEEDDDELKERIHVAYLEHLETMFDYSERLSTRILGYEVKQIFLIHANRINALYLDQILERLTNHGYRFISLEQALKDRAYQTPDSYIGKHGISWLRRWALSLGTEGYGKDPDPPGFILNLYEEESRSTDMGDKES